MNWIRSYPQWINSENQFVSKQAITYFFRAISKNACFSRIFKVWVLLLKLFQFKKCWKRFYWLMFSMLLSLVSFLGGDDGCCKNKSYCKHSLDLFCHYLGIKTSKRTTNMLKNSGLPLLFHRRAKTSPTVEYRLPQVDYQPTIVQWRHLEKKNLYFLFSEIHGFQSETTPRNHSGWFQRH